MEVFRVAGEELEKRWRAVEYDEKAFPALAADVLSESRLFESASAQELIEWALAQTELPNQQDLAATFGDPPITLFNAPRFHIDVYYWIEGTTAIHQHGFCGAFQVFHGSSIHSWYEFETERELNVFAKTGTLRLKDCELLEVGAIQKILPGAQYIHALFHLDQPSATIVARTTYSPLDPPQYSYYKPGFAGDPFFETPITVRKLQFLSSAIRAALPDADRYLEEFLRKSDFFTSFHVMRHLRPLLTQKTFKEVFGLDEKGDRFEHFLKLIEEVHPELGELPREVFGETLRTERIVALRSIVSEPEHRFFLALLLNVEGAENVLSLIRQRYIDEDPLDKLLDWVSELANTKVIDGSFPNGLGIEGFSDFDTAVLEEMLHRKGPDEIERSMFPGDEKVEDAKDRISASIGKISGSLVLGHLVS